MNLNIKINNEINKEEFGKCLTFISEQIISYRFMDDIIEIELEQDTDCLVIKEQIDNMMQKFITVNQNKRVIKFFKSLNRYQSNIIQKRELFYKFSDGVYGLKGKAIWLYNFFEKQFEELALSLSAKKRSYPNLLPISQYKKTGYLKNSPQYAIFCSNVHENVQVLEELDGLVGKVELKEKLNTPLYALSPSACFHTYIELENKHLERNSIFTFTQNVFRNEGRLNYSELGRFQDYHVREIVFVGDELFVNTVRSQIIDNVIELIEKWKLNGKIAVASDPFVVPKMQKYKKIQIMEESKYECLINVSENKEIAVASFNLHGTAFSYPFNFTVEGCENTVTGCVGFGLERWVLAFLSQYGDDVNGWPDSIRDIYIREYV